MALERRAHTRPSPATGAARATPRRVGGPPRESGSDPRIWSGGDRRREASSAVTQTIPEKLAEPRGEFSFLCEGQGALEWVRPEERGPRPGKRRGSGGVGELSLVLENPGEKRFHPVLRKTIRTISETQFSTTEISRRRLPLTPGAVRRISVGNTQVPAAGFVLRKRPIRPPPEAARPTDRSANVTRHRRAPAGQPRAGVRAGGSSGPRRDRDAPSAPAVLPRSPSRQSPPRPPACTLAAGFPLRGPVRSASNFLEGQVAFSHTRLSNNRSVMPLDVRGCTRATLSGSACVYPSPRGVGNPLNPTRDRDWGLQLFPMNEEFPVSAGHKLALIKSLPFVHTARRYYRLDGLVRSSDRPRRGRSRSWRSAEKTIKLDYLEEVKVVTRFP
ncbi:hypothetical protein PAMP_025112 [Pampus punctatissimus]